MSRERQPTGQAPARQPVSAADGSGGRPRSSQARDRFAGGGRCWVLIGQTAREGETLLDRLGFGPGGRDRAATAAARPSAGPRKPGKIRKPQPPTDVPSIASASQSI